VTVKRIWHGWTTPENADIYERLLREEVSVGIEAMKIAGLRRFEMMRRPQVDEVEFVTIMEFDDIDAVKAFVDGDYEACYVPEAARRVLKRFDERSQHYDLLEARSYG
jgi:antibiotic biosynthesis monooxygenase (ABM) superfamily enzyme